VRQLLLVRVGRVKVRAAQQVRVHLLAALQASTGGGRATRDRAMHIVCPAAAAAVLTIHQSVREAWEFLQAYGFGSCSLEVLGRPVSVAVQLTTLPSCPRCRLPTSRFSGCLWSNSRAALQSATSSPRASNAKPCKQAGKRGDGRSLAPCAVRSKTPLKFVIVTHRDRQAHFRRTKEPGTVAHTPAVKPRQ
jgi:hypothetical protein